MKIIRYIIASALVSIGLCACTDTWDSHYSKWDTVIETKADAMIYLIFFMVIILLQVQTIYNQNTYGIYCANWLRDLPQLRSMYEKSSL